MNTRRKSDSKSCFSFVFEKGRQALIKPVGFRNRSSMGTSSDEIPGYIKDMELCRTQDKIKSFYEHCQNKYECVRPHTTLDDIQDYGARLLKEFLWDENSLILDVGCNVGDTGKALRKAGFSAFHGIDPSKSDIQVAKNKNFYSKLYTAFTEKDGRLPCPDK